MADSPARRPRGRPGHDREAVLRTAIELFNERGYDATSVNDLATALGVTKSAVYHHFPSKDSLLAAALDEALEGLSAAVDEAAAATRSSSAYDRLSASVAGAVRILVEHLPAVTLLLRVRGNSAVEQDALARRRRIDARLAEVVRDAASDGALRADLDPDLVSRLAFGMVNSLVDWARPDRDADALAAAVTGVLFDGLRNPHAAKPDEASDP